MITQKTIERLSKIGSHDHYMTSLYLNLDKPHQHGGYKIALKEMLKERRGLLERYRTSGQLNREQAKSLEGDFDKIERFIQHEFVHKDASRGLAVFASQAARLWEVMELPLPVADYLNADFDPYIRPLSELLCEHRHYAIVLIDSAKAKILDVNLGFVREHMTVTDPVPAKTKFGGSEGTEERKTVRAHDGKVQKHFKHVAAETEKLFQDSELTWLIIGGRHNLIPSFESALPSTLRKKVVGHLTVDPDAPLSEVLDRSQALAAQAESKYERELIDRLRGESSNGGKGIFGLQPTLQSLRKGGVGTLVVTKGFQAPGFVCHKCFFIGTPEERGRSNTCPICSGPAHSVGDVVEEAITFAYMQGCTVETTAENSRMRIMGDVGALLRY